MRLNSYIDNSHFKDALALINSLLRELKKLDDKMVLTEVHLLESRVHYALSNLPKAKVGLLVLSCSAVDGEEEERPEEFGDR